MSGRLDAFFEFVRRGIVEPLSRLGGLLAAAVLSLIAGTVARSLAASSSARSRPCSSMGCDLHPPFEAVRRGEILVRTDALDGSVSVYTAGTVLVLPGIHQVRRYSIRDQVYRPTRERERDRVPPRFNRSRDCRSASISRFAGPWTVPASPRCRRNFPTTSARISSRPRCRESSIPPLPATPCARSSRSGGRTSSAS